MTIVANSHPFVIGVDSHARTHTLAIVVAATGELLASEQFPTTTAGLERAIAWAARRTGGDLATLWVIEGVGTYGAGLAREAVETGYQVVEAPRMDARGRRGTGKSDPLDARRIATAALPLDTSELRHPRAEHGVRAALRVLVVAREHMSDERTASVNALTALLRTVDLGIDARRPLTRQQVLEVASWRSRPHELARNIAVATARAEAVRLAKRIHALDAELAANQHQMRQMIDSSEAAPLLDKTGIGPVTAAVAYTAWSHHG